MEAEDPVLGQEGDGPLRLHVGFQMGVEGCEDLGLSGAQREPARAAAPRQHFGRHMRLDPWSEPGDGDRTVKLRQIGMGQGDMLFVDRDARHRGVEGQRESCADCPWCRPRQATGRSGLFVEDVMKALRMAGDEVLHQVILALGLRGMRPAGTLGDADDERAVKA